MEIERFITEKLTRVALLSREFLSLRRSLASQLSGRDVSELLNNEYLAEVVLGGLRVEDWRRPRYPPSSLAGFYHDILGVSVDNLKLLLARLSDGLPLRLATRGIRVVVEETEPLELISAIEALASSLLSKIGKAPSTETPSETSTREPSDQHTAIEILNEMLVAILETLPPYSEEAQILFTASNNSLPEKLYKELPETVRRELEELGLKEVQQLPGCPEDPARCLLGANGDTAIGVFNCYVKTAIRLLQDKRIRNYYSVPDPLKDLIELIDKEKPSSSLLQELAQYAKKSPCLPRDHCSTPAPCLPTGYIVAEIRLPLRDVIVQLPGENEATISEILEDIYPQLCKGLARIQIDKNTSHVNIVFVTRMPAQTPFLRETH